MSDAPVRHVDLQAFAADPYPILAQLRAEAPIAFVPELGATLLTRRDDIFEQRPSLPRAVRLETPALSADVARMQGRLRQLEGMLKTAGQAKGGDRFASVMQRFFDGALRRVNRMADRCTAMAAWTMGAGPQL